MNSSSLKPVNNNEKNKNKKSLVIIHGTRTNKLIMLISTSQSFHAQAQYQDKVHSDKRTGGINHDAASNNIHAHA